MLGSKTFLVRKFLGKKMKTRLISIVSKPIKLICGQTNFDEKIVKTIWVKKVFDKKKFWVKKKIWVKNFWGQ